ncbi:hypothetical protein ANRL1_00313 [Anaerolineae bacterium]|nr:hypothetical protein ANRL1_00313 [Anaerolineae bacterium]
MRTIEEKFRTVLQKNTFYFYNPDFEERYEVQNINALNNLLQLVQTQVRQKGVRREIFEELLRHPNGLRAMLALTGFSNESLKRLTTFLRVVDDETLDNLVLKARWLKPESESEIKEWSDSTIENLLAENTHFRQALVNLFFEGASNPTLARVLPPFELRKLSIDKLSFRPEAMIDTLVRYKEKGSYSGKKENNPEIVIERILDELGLKHTSGDLQSLVGAAFDKKRTMDFIIPSQANPKIIAESSFLVTTSSGQGDKSKTEISVRTLIAEHYPSAKFIGFVDGIGWYARQNDLKRMVSAYDDVYTFHTDELNRFKQLLVEVFAL